VSLPAQHRLRHRKDFSKVYRYGAKYSSENLVIRTLKIKSSASSNNAEVQSKRSIEGKLVDDDGDRPIGPITKHASTASPPLVTSHAPTLVGISVSQKVSKRAVVRNRIKRQLKAVIRNMLPSLNPGWLVVIVVQPSAIKCDYWQFLQELEQTLKRTEVLNGNS